MDEGYQRHSKMGECIYYSVSVRLYNVYTQTESICMDVHTHVICTSCSTGVHLYNI